MPTFKTKEEYERWKTGKLKEDGNLINDESPEKESILEGQEKEQNKQIQNKKICKQMAAGFVIPLVVYFLSTFILSELILTESDRYYHMTYIEETNKKIDNLNEKLLLDEKRNKEIDRINKNIPGPIKYSPIIPYETDSTDDIKNISFWISVMSFCFYMAFLSYIEKKNSKKKGKR